MEMLAKIGIDWKLLLAQAVNFAVAFWVLRRYAYQPMLDFLEKRTNKIETGLKDAELAARKLSEMEAKEKMVLAEAHKEAKRIMIMASEAAKKRDEAERALTEERLQALTLQAEQKIREEKERVMASAKQELGELVMLSVEKILQEKKTSL